MSGPWEQFESPGRVISSSGPWEQFKAQQAAPEIPMFDGIDLGGDRAEVRSKIAALPPERREAALKAWADATVQSERRSGDGLMRGVREVNNFAEAIARGTPIGSWGDEIDARLKDAMHRLTRGVAGYQYDEAAAYNRARQEDFDRRNPMSSLGLKVAGAVATLPLAPGIRSAQGASMLSRMGAGAATGAGYGALYGAGEGTDAESRVVEGIKGTALGAGLGAAAVPVATGIGNAARYAADKYRGLPQQLAGMSPQAVQKVSRAAADDGLIPISRTAPPNQRYAEEAARLGPEGMLADMGPNLLSQTQAITRQRGVGQRVLQDAIEERAAGAAGRIARDTDAVLGPARNLVDVERVTMQQARQTAAPLYDEFYSTTIPVSQQLVTLLQRVPQPAWSKVQTLAQAEGVDLAQVMNTGRGIDLLKRGLDDMARGAGRGTNEERIYSGLARSIRNEVDTLISPQNPAMSSWAQARAAAGEGLQFREALEEGRGAFSRGTHPDQLRADLAGMNPVQRAAFQEGARGQIRDIMGNATMASASPETGIAAASAARKALGSDYARQKLGLVVDGRTVPGRAPPETLANRLDAETAFADTRNRAWLGSQTSNAMLAAKEFPNAASRREAASAAGQKGPMGIATEAVYRLGNALMGGHIDARNQAQVLDVARMLSAQGFRREEIVRGLREYARSRGMSQQGRDAVTRYAAALLQSPRSAWISSNSEQPRLSAPAS